MATQTLLQIVQNILQRLDSDEVNSISDTTESLQVANIVQNKYYDILARNDLPEQKILLQLTSSSDATKPTLMYVPAGVSSIDWIKYFDSNPDDSQQVDQFGAFSHALSLDLVNPTNWITTSVTSNSIGLGTKTFTVASSTLTITTGQGVSASSGTNSMFGTVTSYIGTTLVLNITQVIGSGTYNTWTLVNTFSNSVPGYKYVTVLPIDQFLDMVNRFNPSDSDVGSFTFTEDGSNFTLYYKNDLQPKYCTVLENYYVLFDSYDNEFDSTLQGSKTLVFGQQQTPFQLVDSFVPDLDDNQFPLLINESTSLAFFELKQMPHVKADQEIKRQWSVVQKNKSITNKPSYFEQLPHMGRVPRTGGYASGGYAAYKWMRQTGS